MMMERFDENFFGELRANAEADVADLANHISLLGEKADFLFLAKAHLPEAMFDLGRGGKLLDAHVGARANVTQRANKRLRTFRIGRDHQGAIVHRVEIRLIETELQEERGFARDAHREFPSRFAEHPGATWFRTWITVRFNFCRQAE